MGSLRSLLKRKNQTPRKYVLSKPCLNIICYDMHNRFMKKSAFIDCGEVYLKWYCEFCETYEEIPWPTDWPSWVSDEFLASHGYVVEYV